MKLPQRVRKRNECIVPFKKEKVEGSVRRTFRHLGNENPRLIQAITERIYANLEQRGFPVIPTAEIREAVTKTMKEAGQKAAADAYHCAFLNIPDLGLRTVIKRDGRAIEFSPRRIFTSVRKAFSAAGIENATQAELVARGAVEILDKKFGGREPVPAEFVRETVQDLLARHGLPKVLKAYLRYRYF